MRLRVFLIALVSLGFKISVANSVPTAVEQYLKDKFPEWQIVSLKDYGDFVHFFIEEGDLPFYCSSDFNGDGHPDHAVLLKDCQGEILLYAILSISKNGYQSTLVDRFNQLDDEVQLLIRVEKKGEWESITEKIYIPNDGISLDLLKESSSCSYYFKNDHFEKFLYE